MDDRLDIADNQSGDFFEPVIAYTYRVGDREFTGTRLHFGVTYVRTRECAEAVAGRYPPGAGVQVRVDPERPERAVLESTAPGSGWWFFFGIGLPLLYAIFAVVSRVSA